MVGGISHLAISSFGGKYFEGGCVCGGGEGWTHSGCNCIG